MRKLGAALTGSLLINALLSGWLVAQYLSDVYFRGYIDQFFGSNSTYIILTIGVGGGSTMGYLFLRRKGHVDHPSLSGLQKMKPFKANGGVHSPSSAISLQGRGLPTGAPPTQPSKHTAYAVPPISKGSSPSSSSFQKSTPGSAWTGAGKPVISKQPSSPPTPTPGPRQSTPSSVSLERARQLPPSPSLETRPVSSIGSSQTTPPAGPSSFTPQFAKPPSTPTVSSQRSDQFLPPHPQSDARQSLETGSSKWTPEQGPVPQRNEPSFSPAKPAPEGFGGGEMSLKRVPIQGMGPGPQQSSPQPQAQPQIPTSRWQSSDSGARPNIQPPGQWVSPVPRQPYSQGPRPGPPGTAVPGQRPQPPSGLPVRPGQATPPRPLFPPGQGAPRPLAYPGAPRPMPPGQGTPGAFRPGLVVTGPQGSNPRGGIAGETPGQRPPVPSNFSQSPDPRNSTLISSGRPSQGDTAGQMQPSGQGRVPQGERAGLVSSSSDEKPVSDQSSGVEMDWDTALDTILKTLRKDKVGEK